MEKVTVRVPNGVTSNAEILLNDQPLTCTRLKVELLPNDLVHCEIDLDAFLDMDFDAPVQFGIDHAGIEPDRTVIATRSRGKLLNILEINALSYFSAHIQRNARFGYDPRNSLARM